MSQPVTPLSAPPSDPFAVAPEAAEIVALGYSWRFAAAVRELLNVEGGWVNDPADRGGATKYGISLRFLASEGAFDADLDGRRDFDLDIDGDIDWCDVRALTRADAVALYHRCFWQKLEADQVPAPFGEMLFDQAVNGGLAAAKKLLQRAINHCAMTLRLAPVAVDGVIGKNTLKLMQALLLSHRCGKAVLAAAFRDFVAERYREIVRRNPAQRRFLKGWLARAGRLGLGS